MNSERIFSENRVPPVLSNRQRHNAGITDNRAVTQQQRQMITAIRQGTSWLMPIQRATEIDYTIQINPAAAPVTVGCEMKAKLDPVDQNGELAKMGYGAIGAGQRGAGAEHFSVNVATNQVMQGGAPVGRIYWGRAPAIAYP